MAKRKKVSKSVASSKWSFFVITFFVTFIVLISVVGKLFLFGNLPIGFNQQNDTSSTLGTIPQQLQPIPTRAFPIGNHMVEYKSDVGNFSIDLPKDWLVGSKKDVSDLSEEGFFITSPSLAGGYYMCLNAVLYKDSSVYVSRANSEIISRIFINEKEYPIYRIIRNYSGKKYISLLFAEKINSNLYPNSTYLRVEANPNCVMSGIDGLTLSVEEQIQSQTYKQALEVIESLRFATP